ncbi:hypothetical protein B0T21DRAFT_374194 [Apiosordaria backusii]|uniref:Uncharacterized protein n=1 Tax=Apiosordaria backusii TaxID=314023 RepID=A0AA40DZK4_9PEZI|nr:hypothetical protein B0T21DRAFT_374194 [Apiosordaria backusii]
MNTPSAVFVCYEESSLKKRFARATGRQTRRAICHVPDGSFGPLNSSGSGQWS